MKALRHPALHWLLGLLHLRASKIILAAAVIDDILGLIVLAMVSSMARGKIDATDILITTALAVGFTLVIAIWGTKAMRRDSSRRPSSRTSRPSRYA